MHRRRACRVSYANIFALLVPARILRDRLPLTESNMARAERILWYLNVAAIAALLGRIVFCNLHRRYPWSFRYWLGQMVANAFLLAVPLNTDAYFYLYMAAQSLSMTLSIFVVQELYRVSLAAHPGLSVFGRRSMFIILGIAALCALAGVGVDLTILPGQYWRVNRFLVLDRTIEFIVLVFLFFIGAFLLWFPVTIRRNMAIYIAGFMAYHGSQASAILAHNLLPQEFAQATSVTALALSLLSLLIWLIGLRKEREAPATVAGHGWNPAAAARLTVQLDQINVALAKFIKTSAS